MTQAPGGDSQSESSSGVRLCELVAALSLAADLGLGQPMEHVLRSCLIAVRFADRLGFAPDLQSTTYWATLLATVGCTADSYELAQVFGDDIAVRADGYDMGRSTLAQLSFFLSHVGAGGSLPHRARVAAELMATRGRAVIDSLAAHCNLASELAAGVGLGDDVGRAVNLTFVRWDGKGVPRGVSGEDIPLATRMLQLAELTEVHHRRYGVSKAISLARNFSGSQFDPDLVDEWCAVGPEVLDSLSDDSTWDDVIAAEPLRRPPLSDSQFDLALATMGDLADLKSPWFAGHSRAVSALAADAAMRAGSPPQEVTMVRRAGLVHDLGRTGVPNTIWDKPGPLTQPERERVELHAYYTSRMLRRPETLAELASVASHAHERMDGSGYHRATAGPAVPWLGRIVAAADCYRAMTEDRPYRNALPQSEAACQLRAETAAGRFDADAVDAVLASEGHRARRRPAAPAGLTPREVEVLILVARGLSTRQVARRLGIAPKTVGNHIERIYSKSGASSRAAVSLFAMQHGMLPSLEPLDPV
jgi:HD-GYP domain-containing protein (c-di-GMP phosphodiesterase class II)